MSASIALAGRISPAFCFAGLDALGNRGWCSAETDALSRRGNHDERLREGNDGIPIWTDSGGQVEVTQLLHLVYDPCVRLGESVQLSNLTLDPSLKRGAFSQTRCTSLLRDVAAQ